MMDREEKLQIALEVLDSLGTVCGIAVTKAAIQAELDAPPKRWPCDFLPSSNYVTIKPLMGTVPGSVIEIGDQNVRQSYVRLDAADSGAAGHELIRLGDGDVLDKAAVIAKLSGIFYSPPPSSTDDTMSEKVYRLICELGGGNVR